MMSIMVVDDSKIMRANIKKILGSMQYDPIYEVSNAKDAIEVARSNHPELITLDIAMPGIDGVTAIKPLLAASPSSKIIMVTSQGQEQMVLRSIEAGAKGYLLKPVTALKLKEAIAKIG
jgi:two-component system, chemotaxis family, chemotaxis protein CheY